MRRLSCTNTGLVVGSLLIAVVFGGCTAEAPHRRPSLSLHDGSQMILVDGGALAPRDAGRADSTVTPPEQPPPPTPDLSPPPPPPPPPKTTIADAISSGITQTQLEQDLMLIAGDAFGGRYPGRSGDQQMRAHAVAAFTAAGLTAGAPGFQQPFSWSGNATANVVGVLPGTDPALKDEVVIVGAHHDHMGTTADYGCDKQGGNSICNGADDNGTGTVAVLALARALGQLKGQNRRTIVFLLFGAEERGLKGSAHYIDNPLYPLAQTVYMANIDMIGDSSGSVDALGAGRSQLASGWIKSAATTHGINAAITNSAGSGSDHYNFAIKGVPYVFFHTGLSSCFHTTCDTAEKIHYPQLTKITRTIAQFLWSIAQSDQSPRTDFVSATSSAAVDLTDWRVFTHQLDHAL